MKDVRPLVPPMLTPRQWDLAAVVVLVLATLPWWGVVRAPFIWFDDSSYIYGNADVQAGVTPATVGRAFTSTRGGMWIPLTWLSFMVDVSLFGRQPWGIHLTNLLLHAGNGLLVYAFFRRATGNAARSLLVALFWMVHPLRVESVAWATERKDVLSLLFGLLALLAYERYVRAAAGKRGWYGAMLGLFACSLMAKPMLVTLPCVMLLLDVWPLGRWPKEGVGRLLVEKVPLVVMGLAISVATLAIPAESSMLVTMEQRPLWIRLGVAVTSYGYYLRDMVWFDGLSFFYPLRQVTAGEVVAAVTVLAAITGAGVWLFVKRRPIGGPVLVGWLWFLGAMVPTSGLFQIGSQSRADRFTYYPAIGLIMAVVWAFPEGWFRVRVGKMAAGLLGAGLAVAMGFVTYSQVALWQEPLKLYYYSAVRSAPNFMMEFAVGKSLQDAGELQEAAGWYLKSIESLPTYPQAHHNLATILVKAGHLEEAVGEFKAARDFAPGDETFRQNYEWAVGELARQKSAGGNGAGTAATTRGQ